ncbi:hypothetical protein C8J57DRAFT_132143 [Mycena rebaudengoi]|nr:hypothetical protein C8J57DRAFT_132143 [Mycena rebaudengoi]
MSDAMVAHDLRVSGYSSKFPICGLVTRRLLSLGPLWVDLSAYSKDDLDALRRYDALLLRQHGSTPEGVYPWVPTRNGAQFHYEDHLVGPDDDWRVEYVKRVGPGKVGLHEVLLHDEVALQGMEELARQKADALKAEEAARMTAEVREGKKRAREDTRYSEEVRARAKRQREGPPEDAGCRDVKGANGARAVTAGSSGSGKNQDGKKRAFDQVDDEGMEPQKRTQAVVALATASPSTKKPGGGKKRALDQVEPSEQHAEGQKPIKRAKR